jgi:hypothetical protein
MSHSGMTAGHHIPKYQKQIIIQELMKGGKGQLGSMDHLYQ